MGQLETGGERWRETSWGTLFVVTGLAWFLSQLKTKSADRLTHIHQNAHTVITLLLHV